MYYACTMNVLSFQPFVSFNSLPYFIVIQRIVSLRHLFFLYSFTDLAFVQFHHQISSSSSTIRSFLLLIFPIVLDFFLSATEKTSHKNSGLLGEKIRTLFPEINEERNTANIALNSQQTIIR